MPKFRVKIDGRSYEVEVESLDGQASSKGASSSSSTKSTEPKASGVPAGKQVKAPLAGTILSVFVSKGDTVKKGQVLLTLEALKLENEITAPQDGKIDFVVAEGTSVDIGQALAVIN